ncbi:MAG: hypothetical protein AABZ15_02955 [Nitrospirota bacterium]
MTMRPLYTAFVLLLTGISALIITTQAGAATDAGPFRQGSVRMSIMIGSGTAFKQDYTILGVGLGYYVADGIEAGVDVESWQGNDPRITRLSPQVLYVHQMSGNAKPYAGVFYRRTSISQYKDLNDAGARAGLLFLYGRKAYVGLGLAYESHLNCDRTVYESCADTYPELRLAIIF